MCIATLTERSRTSSRLPGSCGSRASTSPSAVAHADADVADRLRPRSRRRAGDAGDADAESGSEALDRARGHRLGDLRRDGAVSVDQLRRHAEQLDLRLVRVGDDAAGDVGGGAGEVGQPRRQLAPGAGLRQRDPVAASRPATISSIDSPLSV